MTLLIGRASGKIHRTFLWLNWNSASEYAAEAAWYCQINSNSGPQRGIRTLNLQDRIILDPAIVRGKPIVRGTRLPVTVVVGSLAGGMTFQEIQREYDITPDDIRAALKYLADLPR